MNKTIMQPCAETKKLLAPPVMREHEIGGKKYIVKSVFVGSRDMQTSLLNLAERKAIREMGLDMPLYVGQH
jgi:hypothetical protein